MLLSSGCPTAFEVGGVTYDIRTDARFWVSVSLELQYAHTKDAEIGLFFSSVLPQKGEEFVTLPIDPIEIEALLDWLYNFYACTYERINNFKPKEKNRNKAYDFDIDAGRIYSAFYQTYGIDIEKEMDTMHWWKFKALFDNLSSESRFMSYYMKYRNYDTEQFEYKEDKKGKFRASIDEAINAVSFADVEQEEQTESQYEKNRRELIEKKRLNNG